MSDHPNGWTRQSVGDCVSVLPLSGKPKLPTTAYQKAGRFPIIDQGQEAIAGWTDDAAGLITADLPVIVFGDHTRAIKYLDRPFVRGADGTQVLKPRSDLDPVFLYYALRSIHVPNRGYNRHFSVFKELGIAVPSDLVEQQRISEVMRTIDAACTRETDLVDFALRMKQSVMRSIFARGLRGEPQKETEIGAAPASWEVRPLLDVGTFMTGGTPPKSDPSLWHGPVPWVSGKDLKRNRLHDARDHISDAAARDYSRIAPRGSILVLVRGMGLAKTFALSWLGAPMAFNQDLRAVVPNDLVDGEYLMHALTYAGGRMLRSATTAAHGTKRLTLDDLAGFLIPVPKREEQQQIAAVLDTIDRKIDLHRQKKTVLEGLFKSLLHKLMTGEIRVTELDLSALAAPTPQEVHS